MAVLLLMLLLLLRGGDAPAPTQAILPEWLVSAAVRSNSVGVDARFNTSEAQPRINTVKASP